MLERIFVLRELGKAQRAPSGLNIVPIEVIHLNQKREGDSSPLNLVVFRNQIGPGRLNYLRKDLYVNGVLSSPFIS